MRDPLTPFFNKALVGLAILYLVLPQDLIPDFILGLGWLDDGLFLIFSLINLVRSSPAELVRKHLDQIKRH